jgi:hypothetical protein
VDRHGSTLPSTLAAAPSDDQIASSAAADAMADAIARAMSSTPSDASASAAPTTTAPPVTQRQRLRTARKPVLQRMRMRTPLDDVDVDNDDDYVRESVATTGVRARNDDDDGDAIAPSVTSPTAKRVLEERAAFLSHLQQPMPEMEIDNFFD